jgi:regulatory protein
MAFARKAAKKKEPLDEAGLYGYAVKALGRHMRTEAELRRLMVTRAEPGGHGEVAVASVLKRLKEHGYLNDQSFAETYTRLRQENDKLGQRRVRQALSQRGVPLEIVREAVDARYANTSEEALAREYLDRKRIRRPESPKDTARVVRRLVTAGYSTGTIYKILRQWDVPDESLAALESLEPDGTGNSE